jgi:hypothetical protein
LALATATQNQIHMKTTNPNRRLWFMVAFWSVVLALAALLQVLARFAL